MNPITRAFWNRFLGDRGERPRPAGSAPTECASSVAATGRRTARSI